jgi:hypothetical protein
MSDLEDLQYPIGRYKPHEISDKIKEIYLQDIANTPQAVKEAISGLNDAQLDTPYRSGGWTIRQVIHHLPDSHINAYIRCKWAFTEEEPLIKAYFEERWAETEEAKTAEPELSLLLLEALHKRWIKFLRSLSNEQMEKAFQHPQTGKMVSIRQMLGLYAWHGKHHVAHITSLRERMKW